MLLWYPHGHASNTTTVDELGGATPLVTHASNTPAVDKLGGTTSLVTHKFDTPTVFKLLGNNPTGDTPTASIYRGCMWPGPSTGTVGAPPVPSRVPPMQLKVASW